MPKTEDFPDTSATYSQETKPARAQAGQEVKTSIPINQLRLHRNFPQNLPSVNKGVHHALNPHGTRADTHARRRSLDCIPTQRKPNGRDVPQASPARSRAPVRVCLFARVPSPVQAFNIVVCPQPAVSSRAIIAWRRSTIYHKLALSLMPSQRVYGCPTKTSE